MREFLPTIDGTIPDGYQPWRVDATGRLWARREHPPIRGVPRDVDGPAGVEIISSDDDDLDDLLDDTEDDQ